MVLRSLHESEFTEPRPTPRPSAFLTHTAKELPRNSTRPCQRITKQTCRRASAVE